MNKRAEKFKEYLDANKITSFVVEEPAQADTAGNVVFFKSNIDAYGHRLPLVILIDETVFVITRVALAVGGVNAENRASVLDPEEILRRLEIVANVLRNELGDKSQPEGKTDDVKEELPVEQGEDGEQAETVMPES